MQTEVPSIKPRHRPERDKLSPAALLVCGGSGFVGAVTDARKELAAIAAFASFFSGLLWHLPAKAALDAAQATGASPEALRASHALGVLSLHQACGLHMGRPGRHRADRIGQRTMRNLDISDTREKLGVYPRAGLLLTSGWGVAAVGEGFTAVVPAEAGTQGIEGSGRESTFFHLGAL